MRLLSGPIAPARHHGPKRPSTLSGHHHDRTRRAPSAARSDADWLALCVNQEAAGEPDDGRAAVAHVVLKRQRLHYPSVGTVRGTVTWPSQFSWCEFDIVHGVYQRVCEGSDAITARAVQLFAKATRDPAFSRCAEIARAVRSGAYVGGPSYQALTPDTVLYALRELRHPAEAAGLGHAVATVAKIGPQDFYRRST